MTKNNWLSPVQLLDSSLLGSSFQLNLDYGGSSPIVSMTVSVQIEHPENTDGLNLARCVFVFDGKWHEQDNAENIAFTASCSMGNVVSIPDAAFSGDISPEQKRRIADANAVSLVYGKIRSFIEDLTAQSPVGRQTIPAIDPYALLDSFENGADGHSGGEPSE